MTAAQGFSPDQWTMLRGTLRLRTAGERDARSLTVAALCEPDTCRRLLAELAPALRSPSPAITASLLSKRLAFLATGACLYAMSACDKGLRLSPANCLIEYGHDDGLWTSSLPLHDVSPFGYARGGRDVWRRDIVRSLFAELLAPLWNSLSAVSGIALRVLWENTAVRVYSLYERRLAAIEAPGARARCDADFDWLLHGADAELFGHVFNPLQRYRRPPTLLDGREVRLRRTCCLYYKATEPVEYCSTCPLLRPRRAR